MAARLRPHLPALAGALLGIAVMARLGLLDFYWSDYDNEAAPAFKALAEGHLQQFLALSPSYGGSLVLRARFGALRSLGGGGEMAGVRAGSLPCMAAMAGLGVWLVARMRESGQPLLARATVLGLCAAGPIAERALEIGHPEELLGAVLCVAAVLAASGRRGARARGPPRLAIATKAWGLVAVAPVVLALPGRPWRTLAVAALVTASLLAPLAAAHPQQFAAKSGGMAGTGTIFQPWQAWWFLGETGHVVRGTNGDVKRHYRVPPAWIERVTHPLIVLLGPGLALLLWLVRGRRRLARADALLFLALLMHLRCVLDTWNFVYYSVPFLLALVAWESLARRRPPVFSLLSTMVLWVLFQELPPRGVDADVISLAYMAWAAPVAFALGARLYAPGMWARLGARLPSGMAPVPATNIGPA